MEACGDDDFIGNGSDACEQNFTHCADDAIQPFETPNCNAMLWDHQSCGSVQIVHLSQYRKPLIRVLNKIIGTGSGMVMKLRQGTINLTAMGSISYNTDSIDGGLQILLNKVQENCSESSLQNALFTAPVLFAKNISIPSTIEEEYYNDLKAISEPHHYYLPIDPSRYIKLRLKCLMKGLSCQIMVEMMSVATKFTTTPVPPIRTVMTALSNKLSYLSSRKERQTGFLVMDKSRKLVLLLKNDPKVSEFPVIGLWVSGVPSVIHSFVWLSFLWYIDCTKYLNRLCFPPQPFLLALYSTVSELPEYYNCTSSDESENLTYDLFVGCAVAPVSRFPTFDVTVTNIEVSRVADKRKWKYFVNAENQLLRNEQQPYNGVSSVISINSDDIPQISPVPQSIKMVETRPFVPDLSLPTCSKCECENINRPMKKTMHLCKKPMCSKDIELSFPSYSFDNSNDFGELTECNIQDEESCNNCNNNITAQTLQQPWCHMASLCQKPMHSKSEESPFLPYSIGKNNHSREKADDISIQDNVASNFKLNSQVDHSCDYDKCTYSGMYEEYQQQSKKENCAVPKQIVQTTHENCSKLASAQKTGIPKLRHKPNEKYPLPRPVPTVNYHRSSDLQKTTLKASVSTMASNVWPPISEVQETEDSRKKRYVDEALQTDELDFRCHESNAKAILRPVVECVATQTNICGKKTPDSKEHQNRECLKMPLPCFCSHYENGNRQQCQMSSINSSVKNDTLIDMFKSEFNIGEDDNLSLEESEERENLYKIPVVERRHEDDNKNEHSVSNYTSNNNNREDEEHVRLFNIIQDYVPEVPPDRFATTEADMSVPPRVLFLSTSENTKKLNSFAFKYVEPEVLSDFAKSQEVDSINSHKSNNNDYEKVRNQQDDGFKPSSHNVLASQFSVATNRHLEKYLFS